VLDVLRRNGPASRAQLVDGTGLSRATISSLTTDLLRRGRVVELPRRPGTGTGTGRPSALLALEPTSEVVLGVDFGHTRVVLVLADAAHEVVGSRVRRYRRPTTWSRRVAIALDAARDLIASNMAVNGSPAPTAVGVGIPGSLPHREDVVATVTTALSSALAAPVRSDNNARLAGLAETVWGAAKGLQNVAYLKLSHGVGGALVLDGRIHTGPRGTAGEFGHVGLDPTGPLCRCSRQGCLEAYVGLERLLSDAGVDTLAALKDAVDAGVPQATDVVTAAGRRIGAVLAAAAGVVDVAHFVLGGELAALGEHLATPVRNVLRNRLLGQAQADLRVELAALGEYAGALGAVATVLREPTAAGELPTAV